VALESVQSVIAHPTWGELHIGLNREQLTSSEPVAEEEFSVSVSLAKDKAFIRTH
jgi:hypothetical protein